MVKLFAAHPLDAFFDALKHPEGNGVTVEFPKARGMVQVFASQGMSTALCRALKIKETPGLASSNSAYAAIPLAPGQWIVTSSKADAKGVFADTIRKSIKANGYVSEQSDTRVIFRISGPRAMELMEKGCRLDLHPDATGKDWCAQTAIAQMGVLIHQIDEKPVYDLYVYSGFAQDFAEWILHTGAQLGIRFIKP
jgi:sarcosine oxidase subunit gamma